MGDLREALESTIGDSMDEDTVLGQEQINVESDTGTGGGDNESSDNSVQATAESETVAGEKQSKSATEDETNIEKILGDKKDPANPTADKKPVEKSAEDAKKETRARTDRAPQSWKGEAKQLWEQLPLQVRQEVARRERDIQTSLQASAQDRAKVQEVSQVLAPHMDRINRHYNGNPMEAINGLLQAEHMLTVAPPVDRARFIANMIQQFQVDISTLDSILAGQPAPQHAQQQSNIEQLLEQRLAPVQQFIQRQQEQENRQRQQVQQEAAHTVESMAVDADNYPYFDEVREDMADMIELSARRGVALSLEDAYARTVRMNDGLFNASTVRDSSQAATQAALDAHRAAQAAKGASVSVGGSPTGTGRNAGNPADLRGIIENAFGGGRV